MANLLAVDNELDKVIEAVQQRSRYEDSEGRQDCLSILVGLRRRQDGVRLLLQKGVLVATEEEIAEASKD